MASQQLEKLIQSKRAMDRAAVIVVSKWSSTEGFFENPRVEIL